MCLCILMCSKKSPKVFDALHLASGGVILRPFPPLSFLSLLFFFFYSVLFCQICILQFLNLDFLRENVTLFDNLDNLDILFYGLFYGFLYQVVYATIMHPT